MKRVYITTVISFFHFSGLYAQESYRITYREDPILFPVTFNGQKQYSQPAKDRLVFNDSFSIFFRMQGGTDPFRRKGIYANKLIHHGIAYNKNSGMIYNMVAWPPGKKNEMLFTDTLKSGTWVFTPGTKKIEGFTCQSAYSVYNNTDTIRIWYTTEIPMSFGPYYYMGFPGVVLEVTQARYPTHYIATKIEKGNFIVRLPEAKIITIEERIKMFGK